MHLRTFAHHGENHFEQSMNLFIKISLSLISVGISNLSGADTLRITIAQADSIFLKNNYYLLASALNIKAQEAELIQSKLYPNPVFTADIHLYDGQTQQFFNIGPSGQKAFQLDQLIVMGGKRKSEIEIAKTNIEIATLAFQEMIRLLKYELHSSMYALSQQEFLLRTFDTQLQLLDTILTAYKTQSERGNIPLKDVVRLKGVYLNLSNERAELYQNYLTELSEIQITLQTTSVIQPIVDDRHLESLIKLNAKEDLYSTALSNRPDYLITQQNKVIAEQYFHLNKRMNIPDINAFTSYDQRSGVFDNQFNIGVSFALPLWNRNRGNISASRYRIDEVQYTLNGMENEIRVNLDKQYALYNRTVMEYHKLIELYNTDFNFTLHAMSENFQKQNVSILEFVDFFESYINSMVEIARIKIQLAVSAEQLNFTIGKEIY